MTKKIEHKIINGVELKHCHRCEKWLVLSVFGKDSSRSDGLVGICNICRRNRDKTNYLVNPGTRKERSKVWRLANPKKMRKCKKVWCLANPKKVKQYNKVYHSKILSTLKGKLSNSLRSRLNRSLKDGKGGMNTFDILGYTVEQLIKHLIKTIPNGYTWADYLQGNLHLDHKIPVSVFNFEKREDDDFKKCWALSNFQLLTAHDNLTKRAKIDKHFQPALIFG